MTLRTWLQSVYDTIADWQPSRQRQIDIDILWPSIRNQVNNLDKAHQAFKLHCMGDSAWKHISTSDISRIVEKLT